MALLSTTVRRRRQRRRHIFSLALKVTTAAAVLAFTAFSAYEVGVARNEAGRRLLEEELTSVKTRMQALVESEATAGERARRVAAALARLEWQYAANVPQGALSTLTAAVEERLDAGVPASRLAFVIAEASTERDCERDLETKRFQLRTPTGTDVDNSLGFADNRITLSGEGKSARDPTGEAEDWFDPAKPVVLRFLSIDGDVERVEGSLPLTHALIFDGREYRFKAVAGERRGFVEVTSQICAYP